MNVENVELTGQGSIKVLFFTDTHYTARTPKNRKDDLFETSIIKTEEIVSLANSLGVDFCLHGGDFFDRPDVTDLIAGRVAKTLRNLACPLYGIAGGHDLFGNNIERLHNTKLGLLESAGIINILIHPNINKVIFKKGDLSLQLTGTSSHFGIDYENIKDDYVVTQKDALYSLHAVHGMLMPKPFIPGTAVVLVDDIKNTLADITIAGHYHLGFKPVNVDNKIFINPGGMVRKNNDEKEIERIPGVLYLEFADTISYKFIPLKSAQEGEEVLDRSEILKRNAQDIKINNFLGEIRRTSEVKSLDIHSIIETISKNNHLPEKVVKIAVDRVGKMQELLKEE